MAAGTCPLARFTDSHFSQQASPHDSEMCNSIEVLLGSKIGPELTGSNRKNLDYILENIVDPSTVVGAQFRVSTFVLADGRIVTGIIQNQNDRTITVNTPEGSHVIDRHDLDDVTPSEKSLMPDGLLQGMTDKQILDLVGYLTSEQPQISEPLQIADR